VGGGHRLSSKGRTSFVVSCGYLVKISARELSVGGKKKERMEGFIKEGGFLMLGGKRRGCLSEK